MLNTVLDKQPPAVLYITRSRVMAVLLAEFIMANYGELWYLYVIIIHSG